jgi:hypothetical protein
VRGDYGSRQNERTCQNEQRRASYLNHLLEGHWRQELIFVLDHYSHVRMQAKRQALAVQQTLLRAWRYRDSVKEGAPLRPWLYRVATNDERQLNRIHIRKAQRK